MLKQWIAAGILAFTVGAANADTFFVNGTFTSVQSSSTFTIDQFNALIRGSIPYGPPVPTSNTIAGTVTINQGVLIGINLRAEGAFGTLFDRLSNSVLSSMSDDGLSWTLTTSFTSGGVYGSQLRLTDDHGLLTLGLLHGWEQGPHSWDTEDVLYANLTGTVVTTPLPGALPLFLTGLGLLTLLGRSQRKI